MDGLIFDTEALYEEALLTEARALRSPQVDQAFARSLAGLSWTSTRERLHRVLPTGHGLDSFIAGWIETYEEIVKERLELKPGVIELLNLLAAMDIPCAVATGSTRATATSHLGRHGLLDHFAAVVVAEDCVRGKPDPEPFQKAAQALGVSVQLCLALEDSVHGVHAAHEAGMTTIMVPDRMEPDAGAAKRCAFIVPSLLDVPRLLGR